MTVQSIEEYLVIRVKNKSKIMLLVIKVYYVIIEFIYSELGFFESRLNIFLNFEILSVKELVLSQDFNTQTLLISIVNPAVKYSLYLKEKSSKPWSQLICCTSYKLCNHNFRGKSWKKKLEVIRREVSISSLTPEFGINFS